ncbi:hypothetical protein M5689_023585 [Euphorbia peplus]|nr:hypothetical protein M5689_023585 [Euphorbia peplus]
MASSSYMTISMEEFKTFHAIDRELYNFLVLNLWRDPVESMQVLALWLWLERIGFNNVVEKLLHLPYTLINQVADEAIICLSCINIDGFMYQQMDIPLIQSLMNKEISLQFFINHKAQATQGIAKVIRDVCIRAFDDIMQQAIHNQKMASSTHENKQNKEVVVFVNNVKNNALLPPEDRTMFVTFSKGYPVSEWEVREFFISSFGEHSIDSLHMQEVDKPHEQALFARIVFKSIVDIQKILNGRDKVKFNINGKHVWARKFVPKRQKFASPPTFVPMPTPY